MHPVSFIGCGKISKSDRKTSLFQIFLLKSVCLISGLFVMKRLWFNVWYLVTLLIMPRKSFLILADNTAISLPSMSLSLVHGKISRFSRVCLKNNSQFDFRNYLNTKNIAAEIIKTGFISNYHIFLFWHEE